MSSFDTLAPFISAPWVDPYGRPLHVRPLPGLRPEILQELRYCPLGTMTPDYREFLTCCSGLANTALGHVDFTGSWCPEEECPVFKPCMTLAIDDEGRRWIAELSADGHPGRVWCLFTRPTVAVYVSDSLAEFLATLRDRTCHGCLFSWLQDLTAQAHVIWEYRRKLARRPNRGPDTDAEFAQWLATLPREAFVYDLRAPTAARGWPYGLAGPSSRLFRYRDLPVFAVAGPQKAGPRVGESDRSRSPQQGAPLGRQVPSCAGRTGRGGRRALRHAAAAGEGVVMRLKARIRGAGRYASIALLAGAGNSAAAADIAHLLTAVWEPATAYGCLLIAAFCMLQKK